MLKYRLFYSVTALAFLVMAALVINQTVATARVVSDVSSQVVTHATQSAATLCPFSASDLQSLRSVYVKELGIWLPRTDRGYMGLDGGTLSLLNCRQEINQ